jgi:hypothetical protein
LISSESIAILKEYIIAGHYNSKHKTNTKTAGALKRERVATLKGASDHNRMSSENNPVVVPLHCGNAVLLLEC